MTLDQIYQEIQQRSGDTSLTSTQMNLWVNLAIKQWATEDFPDLITTNSTGTTTAGTIEYSLPTDYSKILGIRIGGSASTTEVNAKEYSFLKYENKNTPQGTFDGGYYYYINPTNSTYGLIPTPTITGLPIYLKYQKIPADITSTTDEPPFPENYHELVVFFALKKYWETQDEFDKSIFYDAEYRNMLEKMKTDLMKQSRSQLDRIKDIREFVGQNSPFIKNSIE